MGLTTLTALGSLALQAYGMYLQDDAYSQQSAEARRINQAELTLRGRELAERISVERERMGMERYEAQRKWKWMEEERGYQRANDFVNRFQGMLDREPVLKNQLLSVWSQRS